MAKSKAKQVTGALAEMTGRSDDELRLAMTVAVVVAGLIGVLKLINFLEGLGGRGHRS
jgi:hypothetical protein